MERKVVEVSVYAFISSLVNQILTVKERKENKEIQDSYKYPIKQKIKYTITSKKKDRLEGYVVLH